MQVSDCVDTALTRARQARLPSPLDRERDLDARAALKNERCGYRRSICASTG